MLGSYWFKRNVDYPNLDTQAKPTLEKKRENRLHIFENPLTKINLRFIKFKHLRGLIIDFNYLETHKYNTYPKSRSHCVH